MAINPNEINIKNIIELIQSSSIQDNDLLVIGQGIYARKSTILELYNKFGVPSILMSLNSLQLQINQLDNTLGNSVLYSPQVKAPQQKADARNNLDVYSKSETQTVVNSAIINLGNVVNSVNGVNVDNTDPKNPIVAEFRPIADYNNDMLNKADIDGNLTTGGVWWQDQVLSDRFANYKQVWTALTNNTIEWGNVELDKHIFLVDDINGLKIKVGSTEGTIWNTFNLTNVSQLSNDAGYLQANDLNGYIPYTGANQAIDFNTQSFRIGGDFNKSFSTFEGSHLATTETDHLHLTRLTDAASLSIGNDTSTQRDCIVITLPIRTSTRWVMEIDILSSNSNNIFGDIPTKLLIGGYYINNSLRSVNAISGADNVKSVSFCRDANNNTVIIIRPQDGVSSIFQYGKVNISNFYHSVSYNADLAVKSNYQVEAVLESSLTGLTTNGTITNEQFIRDSYYLDYNNFTNTPNIPTVNDGQLSIATGTGLSGSVNFTANQAGNSSVTIDVANTHKLPTTAEWNALPTTNTITRLRGTTSGTFTSGDLTLLAGADIDITQSGANITITNTAPNVQANNGLLTISTSADLTGGGAFSADQATASNVNIGLSSGTLSSLSLANTALQSGDDISELNNDVGYITSSSLPTVNDGTFQVQGTGSLTGSGSTSANASANTSATLDLTTAEKDRIQEGVDAYAAIPGLIDGVNYHQFNSGGYVPIEKRKTIVNIPTGSLGHTINVDDAVYEGYELAINGCGEWSVIVNGNIMDKCGDTGSITLGGSQGSSALFWWSKDMEMWVQAI